MILAQQKSFSDGCMHITQTGRYRGEFRAGPQFCKGFTGTLEVSVFHNRGCEVSNNMPPMSS